MSKTLSRIQVLISINDTELNEEQGALVKDICMDVEIRFENWMQALMPDLVSHLSDLTSSAISADQVVNSELSVLFCADPTMQKLNQQYRGKDKTTDVLAFPMFEELTNAQGWQSYMNGQPLGDIIINVGQALRQCGQWGNSPRAEIGRLLAHGFLHLLGYDHERDEDSSRQMLDKENFLLTNFL